ncbi:MAG TPA: putative quinol monooxygenase [Telluria sp.]|jgi:quinol monooxygenase YgiN
MGALDTLTIVAHARATPGMEALMIAAQRQLVAAAVASPGCVRYELHESNKDAGAVTFIEEWTDRQSWLAHMESPYMDVFRASGGQAIAQFSLHEMHRLA